ncbi:hypothetical protein [Rhodococcus sp. NPDC060176]
MKIPHLDGDASMLLAGVFAGVEQFFGEDAVARPTISGSIV